MAFAIVMAEIDDRAVGQRAADRKKVAVPDFHESELVVPHGVVRVARVAEAFPKPASMGIGEMRKPGEIQAELAGEDVPEGRLNAFGKKPPDLNPSAVLEEESAETSWETLPEGPFRGLDQALTGSGSYDELVSSTSAMPAGAQRGFPARQKCMPHAPSDLWLAYRR